MSISNSGWNQLIKISNSKLKFLGDECIEKLVSDYKFNTILDIGAGNGDATRYLKSNNKKVTSLDIGHYHTFTPDIKDNYENVNFNKKFDAIWCSHVLEHVKNIGKFLDKIFFDLKIGGVLAITVPPLKHDFVSGHLNLFNTATLLYHLVQAKFDCSKASGKVYGYNISIIVKKKEAVFSNDEYQFEKLKKYFPFEIWQNIDGRVMNFNWQDK